MSAYQGRAGPNFSDYLNNLNTLNTVSPPYDSAQFGDELVDFGTDLSLFTNIDFTHIDDQSLNFADLSPEPNKTAFDDFIPNTRLSNSMGNPQARLPMYSNYNTPIQPAPAANYPLVQSPQDSGPSAPRKKVGPDSPNVSVEEKSRLAAEEDKRRRNTAASARFRVKKKQREQALEKTVKEVQDKNAKLADKVNQLELENKWLKGLITEKHGSQSEEEMATAFQKFRKESEERDIKESPAHTTGVGTD